MKILIAEDSHDLRATLAARFRALGFEVIEARNGAEALALAEQRRPDAALLDVMMPELNGYQVCRRLKSEPGHERTRVVLLTSKSSEADRFWGEEVGADLYLCKPMEPAEVVARVQELLADR